MIMKTLTYLILALMVGVCAFAQPEITGAKWNVTLRIIDENGQPVADAQVSIGYHATRIPGQSEADYRESPTQFTGQSDTNGIFSASHTDTSWSIRIGIEKSGYYSSVIEHQLYMPGQFDDKKVAESRNSIITFTLKKIGNPIPMYAKLAEMKLQQVSKPIGFDLEAGDWVSPYGKGFHTDMLFTLLHRQINSRTEYDCTLSVTFPNQGDGIAVAPPVPDTGSEFKTSRIAAENGYQPELDLHYSNTNQPEAVFGYFIRVRTELNPDGSVKSALYGKIAGNLRFFAGTIKPTSGMSFTYYLNPTPNDRNVEFDPKKNLIKDLKPLERVTAP
jgi:hypothetical protein